MYQGHNVAHTTAHICTAFKGDVISRWTVNRLFQRFKSGDISLEDRPRSGRPTDCNDEALRDALREKPRATTHLAPPEYHLFRALKLHLREKKFDNETQLENEISSFFDSQLLQFWTPVVESLRKRWTYVLDHDSDYVVD
ncbi:hypothetical protein Y032_0154g2953 [Ancylostoma ceylanicum]|uniref:Mos1 transposase HTH domain-containing protein n=1 Tax=Ancylostoma ceylanicum TaxID=53326 RepID=A0A016SZS8_9BILA|nr:hypothetical protein Y032_0154g2953 [Ancylostoma ceylanicum]